MTEQPPVQPPNRPPNQPPNQPQESNAPTQPMSAAQGAPPAGSPAGPPAGPPAGSPAGPPAGPPGFGSPVSGPTVGSQAGPTPADPPKRNLWQQATSTNRRRWGLGIGAGALGLLLLLGIGLAGIAVLRHDDRLELVGDRGDRFSRGDDRPGRGDERGPRADDRRDRRDVPGQPGQPGLPGGRDQGPGGLGSLLNGTALHGEVTASANGSVQALLFQRGEVTAVSATSMTLKSSDGFTGTYGLGAATTSRGAAAVKGGQAFVLARASDKVAIRTIATPARVGVAPSS